MNAVGAENGGYLDPVRTEAVSLLSFGRADYQWEDDRKREQRIPEAAFGWLLKAEHGFFGD